MAKRMLIDATHPEETRVVVVNGTRLEELDVETSTKKQLKGNIYLARVVRVEPSLQAAFVDYGGNRHGFLAFSEIHPDYYQIPVADRQRLLAEERAVFHQSQSVEAGNNGGAAEPSETQPAPEGAAAEAGETVDVVGGDDDDMERRRPKPMRNYKIQEVIKRRQILLVQVVKEERGNKGAALTTYLSLAGRYCVLMPNTARGGGVSRKITNLVDRKRLKAIATDLEIPDGMAVIVRTAGSERTKAEIKRDYEYLLRLWDDIRERTLKATAPELTHEEANLIKRAIRDLYSRDIEDILVDGEEGYRAAKDFMRMLTPSHAKRVQPYRDPAMPLFHRFQIENQLDAMHSPVVQLKSGGYVVINQTEALVAIDVNSGRATKERHIEETAVKTNLEAADEIARQLRLRDLAGLIVIDFIDMEENRNNHAVERRLKEAMKNDRARIQLGRISAFGLLELSRQRLRPSLQETSFQPCTHCGGTGQVRSVESAAVYVLRAIEEEGIRRRSSEITVTVSTPIALYILNQKRAALADIEAAYAFHVLLVGDDSLIPPAYRMDRVRAEMRPEDARAADHPALPALPAIVVDEDEEEDEIEAPEETVAEAGVDVQAANENAAATAESGSDEASRRKRRRRKRRGRRGEDGMAVEAAPGEEVSEEAAEEGAEAAEPAVEGEPVGEGALAGEGGQVSDEESREAERKRRRGKRGGRRRRRDQAEVGEVTEGEEQAEAGEPAEEPVEIAAVQPEETVVEVVGAVAEPEPVSEPEPEPEPEVAAQPVPAMEPPVAAESVAVVAAEVVAETPAEPVKKPRARRKTKAEKEAEAAAAGEVVAEKPAKATKTAKAPAKTAAKKPATRKKAVAEAEASEAPAKPTRRRKKAEPAEAAAAVETAPVPETAAPETVAPPESVAPVEIAAPEPAETPTPEASEAEAPTTPVVTDLPEDASPRRGWWRR